ncbi:MAG: flagellar hook-associated protein FlgK [Candidatus Thiodiazotropha lotti]|uniref:flagellar hook-associated protein FlgK n=1 Tax=Candidatus Thiodiazotropha endoloripes TaxID=1818881 RepID=UPI00083DA869|nr:flagellar hook-associated protein FlgK [Candidatus Thiodiazotropha endoloripes]MCG7899032.1 flagellar hook-associated protein FlgK [Candidatus Thiodiazotropha weberae]MCG8001725.1 flagellar hook-associated protein FlgK [Candidatus Thiodiazotropha lotti]MCG7900787.1 flagellar hook-associated protein FlgK [Candidatus Thiodiazotropha weberae]MCG7916001.1 flagellar hook-associated protein FlgK [Candidatus Thiodiazotropha weberae]MCW4193499.1 flagellar hook-associated protein FlgK [Candidatus Th
MSLQSIGVSGLVATRLALDTTGHNIANVNTDGYSRQRIDFATRLPSQSAVGFIGSGVDASEVRRQYDDFIAGQMRASSSVASELQAYFEGAKQLDDLVANADAGLQPVIQNFFNALQGMADDPASIPARQLVLTEAASLADRFQYFDQQFESMRNQINNQIGYNIGQINRIAEGIAEINADIKIAYGSTPNDLLDKRDQLVNELAELVDIQVLEQTDGAYNVFIGKGQPLVMDTDASTLGTQPSTMDPSHLEITFDFAFGTQVVTDQMSGGEIGGMLRFRDEILDPTQNRVGLVALGIAEEINSQNQLGLDLQGLTGTAMFGMGTVEVFPRPGNGSSITATINDVGSLTGDAYELTYDGADFTLRNLNSGVTQVLAAGLNTVDGVDIDINAVGAAAGDTFIIQPTRNAAHNFSLLFDDVERLAAASPLRVGPAVDANGNPLNTGNATITQPANTSMTGLPLAGGTIQLVYDDQGGPTSGFEVYYPGSVPGVDPFDDFITYDDLNTATVAGTQVPGTTFPLYGDISFTISGVPDDGDTFIIGNNTSGTGDNRNALGLVSVQSQSVLLGGTSTIDESYVSMVSDVGSRTRHAELNLSAQESLLTRTKEAMAEVSGVNLDEEAGRLIQYQQAYQASAQVISVASTLFDTLLGAVRR